MVFRGRKRIFFRESNVHFFTSVRQNAPNPTAMSLLGGPIQKFNAENVFSKSGKRLHFTRAIPSVAAMPAGWKRRRCGCRGRQTAQQAGPPRLCPAPAWQRMHFLDRLDQQRPRDPIRLHLPAKALCRILQSQH